ncbi:MAG: restriction endonuclease subunit S, partial [bacterium]|nr:restriction endonuclease subunit S [bacterium]
MQTSIVNFQEIKKIQDFRIDAECFKPIHLQTENLIAKKCHESIGCLSESVINFGAYSLCNFIEFLDNGMPFIVTEDIKNNIIDTAHLHYISKDVHKILYKSYCRSGQVLLTMAGAYLGQSAVYYLDFEASSNQAIAKITLKQNSIEPFYLSTFLNCIYGQSQIERFRTGTGQPNLNLGLIQTIKIPCLNETFQAFIKQITLKGIDFHKQSKNLYNQAEQILLSELGLLNWKPKHRLSFVKNFSDTDTAGRIDAEYFQPKYEEIVDAIKSSKNYACLGDPVLIKKCIEPGSEAYQDSGIPFLR